MKEFQIAKKPSLSILQMIDSAYQSKYIDAQRRTALIHEYHTFIKEQIHIYKHHRSTSCSETEFIDITCACDYAAAHCSISSIEHYLIDHSIFDLCENGRKELKKDIQHLKEMHAQLCHSFFVFDNEWYQRVLHEQIPAYFALLDSYEGDFHVHHCKEDLDYPLLDGLPVFHDMYGSDGIDLLKEYMNRLLLEQHFCSRFSSELPEFLKHYRICKGVDPSLISINLFELVTNAWFVNRITNHTNSILLQQSDIKRLHHFSKQPEFHTKATQEITEQLHMIDPKLHTYIKKHQDIFLFEWKKFFQSDYDLLIYEKEQVDTIHLSSPQQETTDFLKHLETITHISAPQERIDYLHHMICNMHDLVDLLEHDILIDEEFNDYYQTLQPIELMALLKLCIPDISAFHIKSSIPQVLMEMETACAWQKTLHDYLTQCSSDAYKKMEELLFSLEID